MNVVNTETTSVGFGIRDNIVIGYYCPAANLDPQTLIANTPEVLEAPEEPEVPEGVTLLDGALCAAIDDAGTRPECSEGMCCGMSTSADGSLTIDHCKAVDTSAYEDEGTSFTFECYQGAEKLVMSAGAIAVAAFMSF